MDPSSFASVLDLGVRAVVAPFLFLMPAAQTVLVFDRTALAGRPLLARRPGGGGVGRLAGGEGLRIDVADFIGPAAVVLDDSVGEMAHGGEPSLKLFASPMTRQSAKRARRPAHLAVSPPA